MLLHSFCGFRSDVNDDIWGLFEEWEKTNAPFEYVLEIIDAAASNKVDFDNFNLSAYNKAVRKNVSKGSSRRKNKVLHIVNDIEDISSEPYGVAESIVSIYAEQEDEYKKLEDEEELAYAIEEIRNLNGVVFYTYRVDMLHCIKQALKGLPESINILKNLVDNDSFIGDLLKIVLESGQPFAELFPEAV